MTWTNIGEKKTTQWVGISDTHTPTFKDIMDEDAHMISEQEKKENDTTGREFEWKVVKRLLQIVKKCPRNFVPKIDANGYSNGTKIDDKSINTTVNAILTIPEISPSKIVGVSHIGEDNGNSHGDVKIDTKSGSIGVELKYVSGGSGTWHNTKGTLLNKYLKDDRFTSPKDVMDTEKDNISDYQLDDGLVFGSNRSVNIREEMHAILEPFHQNGIDISDPDLDIGGWGGNMSDKLSHKFRHGYRGDEKEDVDMDEIRIEYVDGKWCANNIPMSKSHQKYWSRNDQKKSYVISAETVYNKVLVPIGRQVMRKVVNQHLELLEGNDKYISQLFMAFLLKVTAKNLTSKLPNYLVAYQKSKGETKTIDCNVFKDGEIDDAQLIRSKAQPATPKDKQKINDIGRNPDVSDKMGYYVHSDKANITFQIQYYWKNGTGLANPVIIGILVN